jgi:hypothetical protein
MKPNQTEEKSLPHLIFHVRKFLYFDKIVERKPIYTPQAEANAKSSNEKMQHKEMTVTKKRAVYLFYSRHA